MDSISTNWSPCCTWRSAAAGPWASTSPSSTRTSTRTGRWRATWSAHCGGDWRANWGLARRQAKFREGDEVDEVARADLFHILRHLDQAVGLPQRGDESGAVAGKLGNLKPRGCPSRQLGAPEFPPAHFLSLRKRGGQRKALRLGPRAHGQPCQHRPHINQKTDEHRDRIAGQPQHHAVADLAEAHRPPGLDGDLPQMAFAESIDALDHVILGALARATRNDNDIVGAACFGERGSDLLSLVGQDADIHRLCAGGADKTLQHRRVGIVDLPRRKGFAGTQDLVSGGQDGHFEWRVAGKPAKPPRGGARPL